MKTTQAKAGPFLLEEIQGVVLETRVKSVSEHQYRNDRGLSMQI